MQKRLEWLNNNGYINNGVIRNTKTTMFLMPLIGISEVSMGYVSPKIFINAHVEGVNDRKIIVIINKLDFPERSKDFVILQNLNEHFEDSIEEEEEYILIYKLPEHFDEDYIKILRGKYSQTSKEYKEIITRVYGNLRHTDSHESSVYDCLYPIDKKRLQYATYLDVEPMLIDEVSSRPRLEYEIFKTIEELDNGA